MDDDRLLETLVAAFLDDPLYRWLYPNETTRPRALRDNLSLTLALVRERGHVEVTAHADAVALWTDPGVELLEDPTPFLDLLEHWAPDHLGAALTGMTACSAYHKASDAVLHVLAVHPERQGRGIAGSVLSPWLSELDGQRTSAYLESSNVRNLTFYERARFQLLGHVAIANDGPTIHPMRRAPDVPS
jgi:GNAT superfamily N-acetyltransferase